MDNTRASGSTEGGQESMCLATDSSSIVDLKAEVFRKQQEARFNKLHGATTKANDGRDDYANAFKRGKSTTTNKDKVWSKQNAGLTCREKKQAEESAQISDREKLVKDSLEIKSRLYAKLHSGEQTDPDGRFLVDFDKSKDVSDVSDDEPAEGEEWVEYVDAFGRSRMAMKKDLPALVERDEDLRGSVRDGEKEDCPPPPSLLSEDMRREILRKKWEREEEENLKKTKLHYRDVLHDEARTHGAAFYNFSRDESARSDELVNLDVMHRETEKARLQKDKVKAKRNTAMEARLKKVRDRKRLKMGLPILDDCKKKGVDIEEEEEVVEANVDQVVMDGIREMRRRMREEEEQARLRKAGPREWDKDKEGVDESFKDYLNHRKETRVYSQQEWMDKERTKRQNEFAPPSTYLAAKVKAKSTAKFSKPPPSIRPPFPDFTVPPPASGAVPDVGDGSLALDETDLSSRGRLRLHNEMRSCWTGDDDSGKRGVGAEIPPPSNSTEFTAMSGMPRHSTTGAAMAESFQVGLTNQLKLFRKNSTAVGKPSDEGSSDEDDGG